MISVSLASHMASRFDVVAEVWGDRLTFVDELTGDILGSTLIDMQSDPKTVSRNAVEGILKVKES